MRRISLTAPIAACLLAGAFSGALVAGCASQDDGAGTPIAPDLPPPKTDHRPETAAPSGPDRPPRPVVVPPGSGPAADVPLRRPAPSSPRAASPHAPPPAPPAAPEAGLAPSDGVVRQVGDQFVTREVSYNKPRSLSFGRPTTVQVIINANRTPLEGAFDNLPGTVQTHQIRVSREMTAELTGPAERVRIQLRPGFSPWQKLVSVGDPTWIWDVTALAPGSTNLDLVVKAKVTEGGGSAEQVIHTYHDTIPVEIGPIDGIKWWIAQIDPIWKWIIGVFAVLGGAYVWWRTNVMRKAA